MRTRSKDELRLNASSQPIRSVEVDLDGLRDGAGPNAGIAAALRRCLKRNPSLSATVYVRFGSSTTFRDQSWSAFIASVGPVEVQEEIKKAFVGLGTRARFSDAIRQGECLVHMHVEDGTIWVPDEPGTWCALEQAAPTSPSDNDEGERGESEASDEDGVADDDEVLEPEEEDYDDVYVEENEQDLAIQPSSRAPRRQRAARNDASVGTIIRKMEEAFGLPRGSVALRDPDRKILRRDALIVTLRRRWDE